MSQHHLEQTDGRPRDAAVILHCLAGQPAPPAVLSDWQRLTALPERAQQGLWELVESSLADVDPALERRAEAFCQLYGIAPADLQASLRVCRLVLSRAAALNLAQRLIIEDLGALSRGAPPPIADTLGARYDAVKAVIQKGLVERMILDHGKILTGLDWRVDRIAAADRGVGMDTPVVLLTLHLRDGKREKRNTVYVTTDAVRELKSALEGIERVLGAAASNGAKT
ncbi:MAG: hypothetical protein HOW73_40590 [Polyangiaceae bacterium]|nr:hypothetical protein [Polyangiaceae bacterium]